MYQDIASKEIFYENKIRVYSISRIKEKHKHNIENA